MIQVSELDSCCFVELQWCEINNCESFVYTCNIWYLPCTCCFRYCAVHKRRDTEKIIKTQIRMKVLNLTESFKCDGVNLHEEYVFAVLNCVN